MATSRTRAYRIYAEPTATANAIASIQCPQNGVITSICLELNSVGDDSGFFPVAIELATTSVSTITQNDTPGTSLAIVSGFSSDSSISAERTFVAGLQVPVTAGDRLFLHALIDGATPAAGKIKVWATVFITQ